TLLGKRVGVFPLIPCKQCGPCKKGLYEMCRNYDYLGSRSNGGFAEYVNVPAENLIILPDSVPFEVAAMLEPMSVAVHAMRKGLATLFGPNASSDKDKDISIAVCGLGAIGLMVITFLLDLGYKNIYAIGNKAFQRDMIMGLDLPEDRYIEYGSDKCKALGESIDLFFECVGTNDSLELGVRSAAPGGVVVTVGNPASDMTLARDIYWKILRNQLRVIGTWNSSFTGDPDDDWHYVIDRIQAGQMDPAKLISHRFSFEELEKGLLIMRDKTENYCKVMAIRK
ncbi:MAG: alcohol dehydrogenase catalytic domain-containing protein, partial [Lachnospiraceae bacterium]|nr:alcohol dehydrogenase catalytic domain-containing protein [Lachnospiraceae bacterium]